MPWIYDSEEGGRLGADRNGGGDLAITAIGVTARVAGVHVEAGAVPGVLARLAAVAQVPDPRWEGMKDWLADFTAGQRGELGRLDEPDADDAAAADAIEWALLAVARKMTELEAGK